VVFKFWKRSKTARLEWWVTLPRGEAQVIHNLVAECYDILHTGPGCRGQPGMQELLEKYIAMGDNTFEEVMEFMKVRLHLHPTRGPKCTNQDPRYL
jgi:hypothetical protein